MGPVGACVGLASKTIGEGAEPSSAKRLRSQVGGRLRGVSPPRQSEIERVSAIVGPAGNKVRFGLRVVPPVIS